ncbi:MAG: DUF58 domain-containing protein [Armatimonadota bacterium]|nr:DUF58 domain-containing protein [Armatimonadota bacterium]MDR7443794.1 DUF58 domain-containing protein [Armatimonadota bacterium]MDR7569037.1 DUF58 domain-containing protein [Armatimonadota bacterium]MDR7613926.1 DUF58 domain-containing protein [Armatimonadota bacterium]
MSALLLDPDFLRELERLTLLVRRRVRSRSGGDRPSALVGRGVEFADYRSYQVGDDYRFVDWNAYARLDRLFVKLTTTEEDLDVHLLLDASASMGFGSPTKMDYAKQLAAALGYISLVNLERVGVVVLQGRRIQVLPPRRGRQYAHTLFSFLEQVRPEGPTALASALADYTARTRRRGVAILLTDLLDPAGYEEALRRLRYGRFETFLVQILSEEELFPTLRGELRLVDAETGSVLEWTSSRESLEAFVRARDGFLEACRQFCFRHGIAYLRTTTRVPVRELVLRYMRAAGLVRG